MINIIQKQQTIDIEDILKSPYVSLKSYAMTSTKLYIYADLDKDT